MLAIVFTDTVTLMSSMTANAITLLLTFPLDTIKTRLQSSARMPSKSRSMPHGGLFRGLLPVLILSAPCCGMYFTIYEALQRRNTRKTLDSDIFCGCTCQLVTGVFMVPVDAIKVCMCAPRPWIVIHFYLVHPRIGHNPTASGTISKCTWG